MKILEFPFNARGFRYELVERQGLVCLVKQTRIGYEFWAYEVVRLIPYPDQVRLGTLVPAHECYPSDEHWGTYGFTYRPEELAKARARFTRMASVLYGEPKNPHQNQEPASFWVSLQRKCRECGYSPRIRPNRAFRSPCLEPPKTSEMRVSL